VKTVADLKGRKVAYPPNTTAQYFLLRQLADAGLSPKDVTQVQLDPATALAALLSHSVDAYAGFGTTIDAALSHGATVLAEGGPYLVGKVGALVGSFNAYGPSLKDPAKAAAIVDFIARIQTALAWTRSHAEDWARIQSNATKQPYDVVLATFKRGEKQVSSWVGPVLPEAIANQQDVADVFYQYGVLTKKVDAKATYSTELDAALAAAETSYQQKYVSWFTTPTWAS
jgi:sulfonate transport system substrate-binding protein